LTIANYQLNTPRHFFSVRLRPPLIFLAYLHVQPSMFLPYVAILRRTVRRYVR